MKKYRKTPVQRSELKVSLLPEKILRQVRSAKISIVHQSFENARADFLEYFRPSHVATKSTLFLTITCSYLRLTTSNRIDVQLD